jgi:hypothetical protein
MLQYLSNKFKTKHRISVERLVSGPGLGNVRYDIALFDDVVALVLLVVSVTFFFCGMCRYTSFCPSQSALKTSLQKFTMR